MTQDQIEKYEICKKDLKRLKKWKQTLPFGPQNHGLGSRSPRIFFELEKIHSEMYKGVNESMSKAISDIEQKIAEL